MSKFEAWLNNDHKDKMVVRAPYACKTYFKKPEDENGLIAVLEQKKDKCVLLGVYDKPRKKWSRAYQVYTV